MWIRAPECVACRVRTARGCSQGNVTDEAVLCAADLRDRRRWFESLTPSHINRVCRKVGSIYMFAARITELGSAYVSAANGEAMRCSRGKRHPLPCQMRQQKSRPISLACAHIGNTHVERECCSELLEICPRM